MYTDQTGRFPTKSYRGMQYIMVLVELDSNAILVEAMRNRTSGEMVQAYQILVDRLKNEDSNQKMHILDNECSAKFGEKIQENNMKYQLVPPHEMWPKRHFKFSRTILLQYCVGQIPNSPQNFGAESYVKPSTSSTYYESQGWTPASQVSRS